MTVRAGWVVQYRLHGLTTDKPRLVFEGRLETSGALITFEFERQPSIRAQTFTPLRVLEVGQSRPLTMIDKPVPTPEQDGYFAPYVWATASATEEFTVSSAIEQSFRTGDKVASEAVRKQVGPKLEQLHLQAKIAAAAFAAHYESTELEAWAEQPIFYRTDKVYLFDITASVTSVQTIPIEPASLNALTQRVQAALQRDNRLTKPLLLAGHWLLSARQSAENSYERFTGFYRVLETLSWLGTSADKPQDQEKFDRLAQLAHDVDPELQAFVGKLRETHERIGIVARFKAMAKRVAAPNVEADVKTFHELNKIRSQLIHGRITRLPERVSSGPTFTEAKRLAQSYFDTVLAAVAKDALSA